MITEKKRYKTIYSVCTKALYYVPCRGRLHVKANSCVMIPKTTVLLIPPIPILDI